MSEQRRLAFILLFLVVLVFSVYSNSLQGDFVYDDTFFIKENPLIRDLSNLPNMFTSAFWESSSRPSKTFYRPLVVLTYAVNFALGGFDPLGYHMLNVLIHVINTLLVFFVVYHIFRQMILSALVGLLFGLHPINTEAVAWVSGRTDLLGTFFSLSALALYVFAHPPSGCDQPEAKRALLLRIGSLLAFLMGLFAKENTATIVGVLVLYEVAMRTFTPQKIRRIGPYLVVLGAYLGWRVAVLGSLEARPPHMVANPLIEEPFHFRLLTGIVIFGKYLWLLLFPARLAVDYSFNTIPVARTLWELRVVLPGLAALGILLLWVFCWRRNPLIFFGIGFFLVTCSLIFANALFPFGAIVGERFMYLPSVGFVTAVVGLFQWGTGFFPPKVRTFSIGLIVAVVTAGFFIRTWQRNYDWRDDFSLFFSGVKINPNSALLRFSLANQYFKRGELDRSRFHYLKALEIYPEFGKAYLGLGNVALAEKNYPEAVKYLSKAVKMLPQFDEAHILLGVAYHGINKLDEAQKETEIALRLNPKNSQIYNNLANIFFLKGDLSKAMALWHKAAEINPFNAEALYNLAVQYEKMGKRKTARGYYRRFLSVAPKRLETLKAIVRAKLSQP
jgi:Flp pilus assembly protein TadD